MVVVPAERWLFSLVLLVFRIPGFSLGFTTAIALVISVLVAGIWLLGSKSVSDLDNHDLETNPNRIIESDEKVLKMSKPDNSIFDDAYQCGWVYVTSEYKAPTSVSLSVLQQVRKGITSRYFRRPKGIFFCVLKHNSLFFFENEEQISCVGVYPLKGCRVEVYPFNLPIDDVYRRESPLRIEKGALIDFNSTDQNGKFGDLHRTPCIYIYFTGGIEKEDWLLSIRQAIYDSESDNRNRNVPLSKSMSIISLTSVSSKGSSDHLNSVKSRRKSFTNLVFMERLNRYINAPGMDPGSQWLNAIVGRVFYNVFRSADVERNLRLKIEKRLRAVERPFFLGKLKLVSVTGGHSLPLFNNGTLHSLSAEGELLASVGIFYPGGFRLTIASELLVGNLLAVPFVMSVYIKHLSGRVLLRIKAPPSDRLWYGFHEQPKLDIEVEPVVSSQAVTWSIVRSGIAQLLSQIISEFMVLPYMDDIPIPPLFIGNVYGGETPLPSDTDDVRSEDEFAVPESNYSKTVDHNGLPIEIGSLHAISSESGDDICRIRSFDEFPITKDDPSNVCDHTKKTSSIDICMDNLPITSLNNGRELGGLVRKHSISVPPKDIVRNSLELDTNDGVRSHPNGRDSFSDADYLLKKSESTFSSNLNDSSTTSQLTSHRLYDEARKSDLLTLHHRHRISQTSTDNDPGKPDRRDEHVPIRKRR